MRRLAASGMLAFFAACAAMASCSGERGGTGGEADSFAIDRVWRRGPVDMRVAVTEDDITIADRVDLVVQALADEGYVTELPRFGEQLHEFGIVDYTTLPPELGPDGRIVTTRTYVLEPFLSGEYLIPPMRVGFREEGDSTVHYIESETLRVNVRSILPEDMSGLTIHEIASPAELPADSGRTLLAAAAVLVVLAAAALLFWRRRRARTREVRRVPAHETAFARLESLLAEELVEDGRYAEFTAGVSDILRRYIEDRFGLRAPERTTEEFLAEAREGLPVKAEHKSMLESFLFHCDLVKFAAFTPSAEDVKRTFETCRDFIESTKLEEVREEAA